MLNKSKLYNYCAISYFDYLIFEISSKIFMLDIMYDIMTIGDDILKVPLRYQNTEYDCGTTSFTNALAYLYDREDVPIELLKAVYKYIYIIHLYYYFKR